MSAEPRPDNELGGVLLLLAVNHPDDVHFIELTMNLTSGLQTYTQRQPTIAGWKRAKKAAMLHVEGLVFDLIHLDMAEASHDAYARITPKGLQLAKSWGLR